MSDPKYIKSMKGYKATDKDLKCQGYQFILGQWHEHTGDIELCKSGFHFCDQPSGPWSYYSALDTRVFEVEAEEILDLKWEPGADFKRVCRRIKFVREIIPIGYRNTGDSNTGNWNTGYSNTGNSNTGNCNTGNSNTGNWNTGNSNTGNSNTGNSNTGDSNTGNSNTGYRNTGDSNTGNSNTGNWNTGDWNTGNSNTGDRNTGYWNTGYWNTGNCNTGNRNTGYRNTGDRNTGYWNTGYWNTGDRNTGDWNATDFSSGFFCQKEPTVICFDVQTKLSRQDFVKKYPVLYRLGEDLMSDKEISFEKYKSLPGITKKKLASLHKKFIDARVKK